NTTPTWGGSQWTRLRERDAPLRGVRTARRRHDRLAGAIRWQIECLDGWSVQARRSGSTSSRGVRRRDLTGRRFLQRSRGGTATRRGGARRRSGHLAAGHGPGQPAARRPTLERTAARAARVLEPLGRTVVPPRMGPKHLSDLFPDDSGKKRSAERAPEL